MRISSFLEEKKEIEGLIIKDVWRRYYDESNDTIPIEIEAQERDGSVVLLLSNQLLLEFVPWTEEFSIIVKKLDWDSLDKEAINVSNNSYWRNKIGKPINRIEPVHGYREEPLGLSFQVGENSKINLLYMSETEYTFDALIVR